MTSVLFSGSILSCSAVNRSISCLRITRKTEPRNVRPKISVASYFCRLSQNTGTWQKHTHLEMEGGGGGRARERGGGKEGQEREEGRVEGGGKGRRRRGGGGKEGERGEGGGGKDEGGKEGKRQLSRDAKNLLPRISVTGQEFECTL